MLPDFTKAKRRLNRTLGRWVQEQIPAVTPLLQGISTFMQHEGRAGRIVRTDKSEGTIEYSESSFSFELTREEMRSFDLPAIQAKLLNLAQEVGGFQEKQLLDLAGRAAASAGNVVHAEGGFTPEKLLEMIGRTPEDFDPVTLQPEPGAVFVIHPETASKLIPQAKEWESNPEFKAKLEDVMNKKREAWRDREASRKLVS